MTKTPYRIARRNHGGINKWAAWNVLSFMSSRPPRGVVVAYTYDGRALWGCYGRTPFEASQRYKAAEHAPR